MSFEDYIFGIFLLTGYICLFPFLMVLGTIVYPIIVGVWLNDYIKNSL